MIAATNVPTRRPKPCAFPWSIHVEPAAAQVRGQCDIVATVQGSSTPGLKQSWTRLDFRSPIDLSFYSVQVSEAIRCRALRYKEESELWCSWPTQCLLACDLASGAYNCFVRRSKKAFWQSSLACGDFACVAMQRTAHSYWSPSVEDHHPLYTKVLLSWYHTMVGAHCRRYCLCVSGPEGGYMVSGDEVQRRFKPSFSFKQYLNSITGPP